MEARAFMVLGWTRRARLGSRDPSACSRPRLYWADIPRLRFGLVAGLWGDAKRKRGWGWGGWRAKFAGAQWPIAASSAYPSGLPGSSEDAWRGPLVPPDPISYEQPTGASLGVNTEHANRAFSVRKGGVFGTRGGGVRVKEE